MADKSKAYDSPGPSGTTESAQADRVKVYEQKKRGVPMWMWLLPLLLAIGLGWWFLSRPHESQVGATKGLGSINFDTDQATLTAESQATLDHAAALMKQQSAMRVRVQGFTDNTGDAAHNVMLSNQRSEAVTGYLVSKGVEKSRLRVEGFGESEPVATNNTAGGKAENRRVELFQQ